MGEPERAGFWLVKYVPDNAAAISGWGRTLDKAMSDMQLSLHRAQADAGAAMVELQAASQDVALRRLADRG